MRSWRNLGLVVLCWTLVSASTGTQTSSTASRAAALVGLARTARDQGHRESAAIYFRDADRLASFTGPLLVEYFWAAHAARLPEATSVGERVLAANPREARVRDGLIGLAVAAGKEDQAARRRSRATSSMRRSLVRGGWASHLRRGQHRLGAGQFSWPTASGAKSDLARWRSASSWPATRARPPHWLGVRKRFGQPNGLDREPCPRRRPHRSPVRRGAAPARTEAQIVAEQQRRLDSAVRDRTAGGSRGAGQR
jgi:hypothetical protein